MGAGGTTVSVDDKIKELKAIACDCQEKHKPKKVPKTTAAKRNACQKLIDDRGKCVTKALKGREADGLWANARFPAKPPKSRLVPDVVITAAGSFPANTTSVGKRARAAKAGMTPGSVDQVMDMKFPCPPALVEPYPAASPATLGFGVASGAGDKELGEYRDICNPPKDVEVFTPNAQDC